jgi:hypothetical protein
MVRTYKRKSEKDADEESMEKAIQAVLKGMTLRNAANLFGVRFNTLFYHIKKGKKTHSR